MAILSGYKTYIIVAAFVACTLLENFAGFDIPGFTVSADWFQQVLAMLGFGTIRAGIASAARSGS